MACRNATFWRRPTGQPGWWMLALLTILAAGLIGPSVSAWAGEQAAPPAEEVNPTLPLPSAEVDRSSPSATVRGFLAACAKGNYDDAIQYFDMAAYSSMSKFSQREAAARDARDFYDLYQASVKDTKNFHYPCLMDPNLPLSTTADGTYPEFRPNSKEPVPDNNDVVGLVDILGGHNEIWLRRVKDTRTNQIVWLFTAKSLTSISLWKAVKLDGVPLPPLIPVDSILPPLNDADKELLHRSTPKATYDGFEAAANRGDWALAAHYLDLSEGHAADGQVLARRLKMILDRIGLPTVGDLSDSFFGNRAEPDMPADQDLVYDLSTLDAKIVSPTIKGKITVWIRRDADDTNGKTIWLFSRPTVESINDWYGRLGYGWVGDNLPQFFFEIQYFGVQLWQALGLAILLLVTLILQYFVAGILFWLFQRWAKRTSTDWDDQVVDAARMPARVFLSAFLVSALLGPLALRREIFDAILLGCHSVEAISFVWLGYRLVDVAALGICRIADRRNEIIDQTLLPLIRRIMKVTVVVVGGLFILQNLNVNVTGLIAALGVGGIAVALAGQKTIENLFGSITIAIDRPFKIGNFCKAGDYLGVIEDIGLRSTRIRTLDRTLVTIPNGALSDMTIENFSHRDRIRWVTSIGVTYSATVEQVQFVVDEVKKLIYAHPKTFNDGIIVRFASFGNFSQNIDVICFVNTTDYMEFTAVREDLCFQFARIVAQSGAGWAFPSQTIYLGKDGGVDAGVQRKIAEEIKRRSQVGELTIPEPSPQLRDALIAQSAAALAKSTAGPDPEKEPGEKPPARNPLEEGARPGSTAPAQQHQHQTGDEEHDHTGEKVMTVDKIQPGSLGEGDAAAGGTTPHNRS
ncbi:MAG: mechanosensitive ion channel family protein [Planctomycetota bacterium]